MIIAVESLGPLNESSIAFLFGRSLTSDNKCPLRLFVSTFCFFLPSGFYTTDGVKSNNKLSYFFLIMPRE